MKVSKKIIAIIAVLALLFSVVPESAFAAVVPFKEQPPGGSGTGGGVDEVAPRGFGVYIPEGEDQGLHWLESKYDNTNNCAIYSGITNGYNKYLPVEKDGEPIEYTFYAYVDRNPAISRDFIRLYRDGEVVDISDKIDDPRRDNTIDPSGQTGRWEIPIKLTLEKGHKYEFAFLRGIQAHNNITAVISEDGSGYLQNNPFSEEEQAWYDEHKYDEFQYREYLYSTYLDNGEINKDPVATNSEAGKFRTMRFAFYTEGNVEPDTLEGSPYTGAQGEDNKLTLLTPPQNQIETISDDATEAVNRINSEYDSEDNITFGFTLDGGMNNVTENEIKTNAISQISVMDKNQVGVIADSANEKLEYVGFDEANGKEITFRIRQGMLEAGKWYSLVFSANTRAKDQSRRTGKKLVFYFKTAEAGDKKSASIEYNNENNTTLQRAVEDKLGTAGFDEIDKLTVSGNKELTAADFAFIREKLTSLTTLNLEYSNTLSIADSAMKDAAGLKNLLLPQGLNTIGASAFEGCSSLKNLDLPVATGQIGNYAFKGCTSLPSSIKIKRTAPAALGDGVFDNTGITEIILPEGSFEVYSGKAKWAALPIREAKTIFKFHITGQDSAPAVGSKITITSTDAVAGKTVTFSETADAEGNAAFKELRDGNYRVYINNPDCAVESFVLRAEGRTIVRDIVLRGEESLTVNVGSSDVSLESAIEAKLPEGRNITGISSLTITTSGTGELKRSDFEYIGGGNGGKSLRELDISGAAVEGNAVPGKTDTSEAPLSQMERLETIKLSSKISNIEAYAFYFDTELETVVIPGNSELTAIGDNAFSGCLKMQNLDFLPAKKISLGKKVFSDSGLTSAAIPAEWESLPEGTFLGCTSLERVTFTENSQMTDIGKNAFSTCRKLNHITLPTSLTSLGEEAFTKTGLTSFDFSNLPQITALSSGLFKDSDLGSVTLSENITEIGSNAFNKTALNLVELPASVTKLKSYAFSGCQWLEQVIIKGDGPELGSRVFEGSGLKGIPQGLKPWTAEGVFANCKNFSKIVLPDGMTDIPAYTFQNTGSKYILVYDLKGIEKVGRQAFDSSTLKISEFPASLKLIEYQAFKKCSYVGDNGAVRFLGEVPPKIDDCGQQNGAGIFKLSNVGEYISTIYVPAGKETSYMSAGFDGNIYKILPWITISLNYSKLTLTEGNEKQLIATIEPAASTKVEWKSDDTDVVTVDNNGRIKAIKAGSATVTAKISSTGKSAQAKITVAKMAAPANVSAKATAYNKIYIKWSAVSGAQYYTVFRSKSQNGSYESLMTLDGACNYTDTGVYTGKTYYYKVVASKITGGRKFYSKQSAVVKCRTSLAKVSSLKAAYGGKLKIKLTWKKVSGASGYKIYRSTKSGSGYKLVKTVTSGRTTAWTNAKLSRKNYYYKVKAYRKNGGITTYGAYSSVVKRRAK